MDFAVSDKLPFIECDSHDRRPTPGGRPLLATRRQLEITREDQNMGIFMHWKVYTP